jgi:SAM-dependent methyltransferase
MVRLGIRPSPVKEKSVSIVYDHPRYYEIAFSFRDIPHEVDVFEECIRRHARVPVHTVLELACGNSPHMPELLNRGYRYVGLDLNDQMLAYGRRKAAASEQVTLVKADMCHFDLRESAEFAFVALGSLYAQTTKDLLAHFSSVARVVPTGGLYLLDWCVYFGALSGTQESWETEQQGIHVKATVSGQIVDPVEQLYEETITLDVTEDGRSTRYGGTDAKRIVHPQEFLLLVRYCTDFEFVGWWNDWSLDDPLPGAKPINRPIVLLRRK